MLSFKYVLHITIILIIINYSSTIKKKYYILIIPGIVTFAIKLNEIEKTYGIQNTTGRKSDSG